MDSRKIREMDQAVVDAVLSVSRQLAALDSRTCDGAPRVRPVTRVRPIRVAPGVRERVIADNTHP